jgi:hypothetical protein
MLRRPRGIFCIARSFMAFRALRRYEMGRDGMRFITDLGDTEKRLEKSLSVARICVLVLDADG